ncbi:MAG TPA: WD40 repeat domain-containing protein, partial [Anaerolineae bacterium]|nr:WD40 repeat domain-containing protein [Anaerolineae bacterium]
EPVRDLAFHPDGRMLAVAGESAVTLWDTTSGNVLNTIQGHEGPINSLAFSRDGAYLATASDDSTARIWQIPSGELVLALAGHNGAVLDVAFNGDGSRLATGGVDKTARLWDAETGQILRTIQGHTAAVTAVTFSPGDQFLTTASKDSTIQINPLNTLEELLSQARKQLVRGLTAAECLQFRHGDACLTETEDGTPPRDIFP